MSAARTWGRVALGAYALFLVVALLTPQPPTPAESLLVRWSRGVLPAGWVSDAWRNVLLFVPVGLAAGATGRGWRRALAAAVAISVAAEGLQVVIPGRFTSLLDVVANGTGGALGVAVHRNARRLWHAEDRLAIRLSLATSALAIGLLGLWPAMLRPASTDADYYGAWTPVLGNFLHYGGRVVEASIGPVPIVRGGPQPDSDALRRALEERAPWRVRLRAGPRPPAIAPIVTVHDGRQREILLLAADRDDLVLRTRNLGVALGFEPLRLRARGAIEHWRSGALAGVEVTRRGEALRVRVDERPPQTLAFPVARGWALWLPLDFFGPGVARGLDVLWLAGLAFPAAFWARRRPIAWLGVAGVCGVVAGAASVSGVEAMTIGDGASLALGVGLALAVDALRRRAVARAAADGVG